MELLYLIFRNFLTLSRSFYLWKWDWTLSSVCSQLQGFPKNFPPAKICSLKLFGSFWGNSYSNFIGDIILILFHFAAGKLYIKHQKVSKCLAGVCLKNFILLLVSWIIHKNSESGWKKTIKPFHKYCSAEIWMMFSVKLVLNLKYKILLYEEMPNVPDCLVLVAPNINYNSMEGFRDTKICRKCKFQRFGPR